MSNQCDLEPSCFVREGAIRVGREVAVDFQEVITGRLLLDRGALGITACLNRRQIDVWPRRKDCRPGYTTIGDVAPQREVARFASQIEHRRHAVRQKHRQPAALIVLEVDMRVGQAWHEVPARTVDRASGSSSLRTRIDRDDSSAGDRDIPVGQNGTRRHRKNVDVHKHRGVLRKAGRRRDKERDRCPHA